MNTQTTKVIVPCRFSYAHIWEPDSINGSEPKYSLSCIISKEDQETIAKIKKAIEIAKKFVTKNIKKCQMVVNR